MKQFARDLISGLVCAAGIGVFGVGVHAQVATLDERVHGAERVVVGTARMVTPEWRENEHGDRLIVSRVVVDVDETLKGDVASTVFVEIEGGTLDGYTLRVSSLPVVQPRDRAVFFLDHGERDTLLPHLRGQGILFLDGNDVVRGSSLRLEEIRSRARAAK